MGYKEIMYRVDKQKAIAFMQALKAGWNALQPPSAFTKKVNDALTSIGIDVVVGAGTANALVTRMERKSGIEFL